VLSIVIAAVLAAAVTLIVVRGKEEGRKAPDLEARLDKLRSVPYTSVTEEKADEERTGVLIHKTDESYPGYNLYCDREDPVVYLIDMNGTIVHRWSHASGRIWVWDHVVMLGNGDVIIINKFKELLKLDWDSNLIWKRKLDTHHDVTIASDGTLYVIERGMAMHRELVVRFPSILHLTSEGEEIERWQTYDHLDEIKQTFDQRSFLDTILDSLLVQGSWPEVHQKISKRAEAVTLRGGRLAYDYLHLNTITLLPETALGKTDGRFKAGNLLICFRNINQIAVMAEGSKEILWTWGEGILEWPHHPTMVANGNILVFDNGIKREYSRVIELNPVSRTIEWEYVADPPESFYTYEKGSAQRLPNGNTLICDGDNGRAFEVTREGEIVWEWLNPRIRKGHRVQLYRIERISPGIVEPLLKND
jgi:hypothetical protein